MNEIEIFPVCAFNDNYIWTLRQDGKAAVVDPGDAAPVLDYLRAEKLELTAILNTHHHADHVGGNAELLSHYRVPVYGPHDERIPTVSHRLREGDRFTLAHFGIEFSVFEIPGHTRSHIAFYGSDMLFCGDTLFACGCGRLFEGTPQQMYTSLAKLAALPDPTRVYCGHEYTLANIRFARAAESENPELVRWEREASAQRAKNEATLPSSIGREKRANPFLRCDQPAVIASASRHVGKPLKDAVSVLGAIRDWKNNF
ncbi:MAG TPA: hydroxyacylglutathione hydrolase [Burkholderiales bacterium]|jgi:hydroxyacylglutathione hydrolase|nr:hydroxyacylglutathione hydrolase [Burkholderiales bacterium]